LTRDGNESTSKPSLRPFKSFLDEIGRTTGSGWRYVRLGWVRVINIAGKNYIEREEEEKFIRRARAGEFSKTAIPKKQLEVMITESLRKREDRS
jgi:hypothetical protein